MIITLVRKPVEGIVVQNAMNHGVGAIHIEASRIGVQGGTSRGSQAPYPKKSDGTEDRSGSWARTGHEIVTIPAGRWPANVLLAHLPECRCVGSRMVPGYTINQWNDGAKPFGGGAGHAYTTTKKAEPESVSVWECAEGCPVKGLDLQSGIQKSGIAVHRNGDGQVHNRVYGGRRSWRSADVGYGDTGGASRYFKQFSRATLPGPSD